MSVSGFSQTSSELGYEPKVIQDSTGVTFFAFDSLQTTEIIKVLKDVKWSRKQIRALEKQLRNVKWKSEKQEDKIGELGEQIQNYIRIEMNLKKQVEVKQEKIENLEGNIEDLKTINNNLSTIKEQYESQIKKLKWHKSVLIGTNIITAILLILSVTSG